MHSNDYIFKRMKERLLKSIYYNFWSRYWYTNNL